MKVLPKPKPMLKFLTNTDTNLGLRILLGPWASDRIQGQGLIPLGKLGRTDG